MRNAAIVQIVPAQPGWIVRGMSSPAASHDIILWGLTSEGRVLPLIVDGNCEGLEPAPDGMVILSPTEGTEYSLTVDISGEPGPMLKPDDSDWEFVAMTDAASALSVVWKRPLPPNA